MTDYKEVIDLFSKLDLNDKRNETSIVLQKIEALLSEILAHKNINDNDKIESNKSSLNNKTEDEILTNFYEELIDIKNKVLLLMTIEMNNKE